MFVWATTDHLELDAEGCLWRTVEADAAPLRRRLWDRRGRRVEVLRIRLGPVDLADVGEDLADELAELLDAWRDALGSDERAEWESTYRRGSGVFRPV